MEPISRVARFWQFWRPKNGRFWPLFWPIFGPKIDQKVVQKWVQNGDPKSPILGSPHCKMGVQKWSKNGPKSEQKVVKKWSKKWSKNGHF